jgi:hypothetical protein
VAENIKQVSKLDVDIRLENRNNLIKLLQKFIEIIPQEFRSLLIDALAELKIEVNETPFTSGQEEIQELQTHFENLEILKGATNHQELLIIISEILTVQTGLDKNKIKALLEKTFFIKDLFTFIKRLEALTAEKLEEEAKYFEDPDDKLFKMIGPEAKKILNESRILGLIPLEAIEKLRNLNIVVIGASVAASTIELLVSLGAENITFVDPGELTISGEGKLPTDLADFRKTGNNKALELKNACLKRNPHGNFEAINARVTLEKQAPEGYISIYDLLINADLVIEVIDDPNVKFGLRPIMANDYPNIPLMGLADLGAGYGTAWFEKANDAFNQIINNERLGQIINGLRDALKNNDPNFRQLLHRAVFEIVREDFPPDHALIFLLNALGILTDWPQTGIAARQSSAIASMLILQWLHTGKYEAENIHADGMPTSFIDTENWSNEEWGVFQTLIYELLSFPLI